VQEAVARDGCSSQPIAESVVATRFAVRKDEDVTRWEYLIVALPQLQAPTAMPAQSAAVVALNREGDQGWEAVGMTALADGSVAVLMKRAAPK